MRCKSYMKSGITVIELLIVVAIFILIGAVMVGVFRGLQTDSNIAAATEIVISSLRQARSQTLASINDEQYGVYFASTSVTVFVGDTYNPSDSENEISLLPRGTEISSINLGGSSEIIFSRLTGGSSASGTVVVSSLQNTSEFRTITINFVGLISTQ